MPVKPTVASFVTFVEPDGSDVPALVVRVNADDANTLDLFVFDGKVDPLKLSVAERKHKDDVVAWHR